MTEPREDGPRLQQLFTKLDGPASFRTEVPGEIKAMIEPTEIARPALGKFVVIAPPTEDSPGAKPYAIYVDGRIEGFPEGSIVAENGILPLLEEPKDDSEAEVVGPVNYAKKLHQAGEAAIHIASASCEAEFAFGNPCNIPEPVLGWYTMTLAYQLLLFEAVERPYEEREMHAGQLQAARKAFARHATAYAQMVKADVAEALNTRYTPASLQGEDLTYGGKVPKPVPARAANDDPSPESTP